MHLLLNALKLRTDFFGQRLTAVVGFQIYNHIFPASMKSIYRKFNSNLKYSFEKSCLSHKLFVTLSSVAVSRQKERSRVSKCFM